MSRLSDAPIAVLENRRNQGSRRPGRGAGLPTLRKAQGLHMPGGRVRRALRAQSADCCFPLKARAGARPGGGEKRKSGEPAAIGSDDERSVAQAITRDCRGGTTKRSRGPAGSHDRSPSEAITPPGVPGRSDL
jgi:hypothetical protein